MGVEEQLNFIVDLVEKRKIILTKTRTRNRKIAFHLKMTGLIMAGMITILLGLKLTSYWSDIFTNIALIFGAAITVINAIDAFFDYRALWIQRTIVLCKLEEIQRDIEYYAKGLSTSEYDEKIISGFLKRFNDLMNEGLTSWSKLRQPS